MNDCVAGLDILNDIRIRIRSFREEGFRVVKISLSQSTYQYIKFMESLRLMKNVGDFDGLFGIDIEINNNIKGYKLKIRL